MEGTKVNIRVRNLITFSDRLNNIWLKRYVGKFKSALAKISRAIDDDVFNINQMREQSQDYNKYLKELQELNQRHGSRNSEGQLIESKPLLPGQIRLIPDGMKYPDAFFDAKKKLDMEYSAAIEGEEKRLDEINKKWNEMIEVAVKHLIRTEDYLEELNDMTGEDYALLSPFLDKDIEEFDLSKLQENKVKKLEKELETKAKLIEEMKRDGYKLEDRITELKEKLLKTEKKE